MVKVQIVEDLFIFMITELIFGYGYIFEFLFDQIQFTSDNDSHKQKIKTFLVFCGHKYENTKLLRVIYSDLLSKRKDRSETKTKTIVYAQISIIPLYWFYHIRQCI